MREHGAHEVRETSLEAYGELNLSRRESEVKAALEQLGGRATADEIARRINRNKYLVMPRLTALLKKAVVEEASKDGLTPSGKRCIVWRIAGPREQQLRLLLEGEADAVSADR